MISPQEKAEELLNEFIQSSVVFEDENYYHPKSYTLAKQCAIKTVDEILKALKYPPKANENRHIIHVETIIYWQEVKEELLKK